MITAAGVIWIIAGILLLLGALAVGVIPSAFPEWEWLPAELPAYVYVCGAGCLAVLGVAHLIAGVRVVRGRAAGLLGFGIFSTIVGILSTPCSGVVGAPLLVAGILALVGRGEYERRRRRGSPVGWGPPDE
jgi:hypothetical protein